MVELIVIAAIAKNNVIGKDGKIPWHISDDFKRFKELTVGHTVIMGRKTFESLPTGSLPGRENIVLTRNQDYAPEGVVVKHSVEEALEHCKDAEKAFFIGGRAIYDIGLKIADVLELTKIDKEYEGDTFFSDINWDEWELVNKEQKDGYSFNTYIRKK